MPRRLLIFFGSLLFGIFPSAAQAAAQNNIRKSALIAGRLADPSGSPISGAEISAHSSPASPAAKNYRAVTSADGHYRLSLPAGRYRVRISDASFAPVVREFTLRAGGAAVWNPRLRLKPLASTVTVTADAEPMPVADAVGPVDIVTAKQIEQRHAVWLAPVLASLPGISLVQLGAMGGVTSLFLDGGNSNFTKVLVDGTPVNEPGGAIDFSNYSLANIEKIEVVHGAESALFGSDAMTGVVQIFTKRGQTRQPHLDVFADGGKFSTWHAGSDLSGVLGRFDYSAGIASIDTNGQGPNDRFRDNSLSGNFGWRFSSADTLRLSVRSSASYAGVAGQTLFLPYVPNQNDALKNVSANLSWDFQTGSRWRHHLDAGESYLGETYSDLPYYLTRNEYNRADFNEQSSYLFGSGAVTAGYEYEIENGFFGGVHARRNNQAGYMETRFQPTGRMTVVIGARAEANASFGTRVVPRLGVSYAVRLGQGFWGPTRGYASYGLGIKEPSFLESFSNDPCFPGNPGLRPERSKTFDAGVDQAMAGNRMQISIDGFRNMFYDVASFGYGPVTSACPYGSGTYFNTDRSRAYGASVRLEAAPMRRLFLSGNYTYDDTRVLAAPNAFDPTELPGNRLFLRPLHSASLDANVSAWRMNWNLEANYVGRRTDSDFLGLGLTSVPSYFVLNLGTDYRLGRGISTYARVDNLLDRSYQVALGYPALRLAYRAGIRYAWGGQ
ncbi:MAG TPA: TonB-dependent receptor [Candidatus Dormibacteraeota bacterium]|nr:TonB-dependent receptor [Candidatus Dormibacteraeota bacterium]